MISANHVSGNQLVDVASDLEGAFVRVRSDIVALRASEVGPVNLDVWAALVRVEGVLPEIATYRSRFEAELPRFDLRAFDRLGDYARAAAYAHSLCASTRGGNEYLRELQEEGASLREILLSDLRTLVLRGVVTTNRLDRLSGTVGYKNLVSDLQLLFGIFKENWPKIAGKCATTEEELRKAAKLVSDITRALGLREQGPQDIAQANDQRARAFTLLTRTYDATRRAIAYLRSDLKDVDDIIPSLYASRFSGRRRKEDTVLEASPTLPAVSNPPASAAPSTTTATAPSNEPPRAMGAGESQGGDDLRRAG